MFHFVLHWGNQCQQLCQQLYYCCVVIGPHKCFQSYWAFYCPSLKRHQKDPFVKLLNFQSIWHDHLLLVENHCMCSNLHMSFLCQQNLPTSPWMFWKTLMPRVRNLESSFLSTKCLYTIRNNALVEMTCDLTVMQWTRSTAESIFILINDMISSSICSCWAPFPWTLRKTKFSNGTTWF